MSADAPAGLSELAADAGIAEHWTDADKRPQRVSPDTLRALLAAMDLPAESEADIRDSRQRLADMQARSRLPAMLIAVTEEAVFLPRDCAGAYRIEPPAGPAITGQTTDQNTAQRADPRTGQRAGQPTQAGGTAPMLRAPSTPGYYTLHTAGGVTTLAVAPRRAPGLNELLQEKDARAWGLAVQVYSLRRPNPDPTQATHGFGDFGALRDLAQAAGNAGADALAISPVHAMFAADPAQCSPYSPSSRLFLNALYADPAAVLGADAVRDALAGMTHTRLRSLDAQPLIDWPAAAGFRQQLLRRLHDRFAVAAGDEQRRAYDAFRNAGGQDLRDHALFEALHAAHSLEAGTPVPWTQWPAALRDPRSSAAQQFAAQHAQEVDAHAFAQWLASASLKQAQRAGRDAGMRVGIVADLAVGASPLGSHAWSRQADLVKRASVGAPPDIYNPLGQGWGLTALSPAALQESGYSAFLAMLRASLSHAGGLRIDHILGMARMWLIPDGAGPQDGGYVRYPLRQLLRLTGLEAWLHRALIVGENLGTVPEGFDALLEEHGVLGMDVLWFMRASATADSPDPAAASATSAGSDAAAGSDTPSPPSEPPAFLSPTEWPKHAVAMTTTHDLPTLEGWWHAQDILWRSRLNLLGPGQEEASQRADRLEERATLWRSVQASSPTASTRPLPRQTPSAELLGFVAATPCPLMLVTLEDLTGQLDQPNLPGTIDQHPNWRQRAPLSVNDCLTAHTSQARLRPVRALRGRS
ncbi:4-alpha-glucanotransferase [Achromobacter sp. AGC39]